jgi:hypothetical protein
LFRYHQEKVPGSKGIYVSQRRNVAKNNILTFKRCVVAPLREIQFFLIFRRPRGLALCLTIERII